MSPLDEIDRFRCLDAPAPGDIGMSDAPPVPFSDLPSFFLAARYGFVLLYVAFLWLLARMPHAGLLAAGAVGLALYSWFVLEWPLERLYAFAPPFDRMFNVAMGATAATGHSPFESYQVAAADLEPFWRLVLKTVSLGRPENVLAFYPYFTPIVMVLLASSLYFGFRDANAGEGVGDERRFEAALLVFFVLLLNSSPYEQFGVFRSFWPMNFLLKPNHVLGFVILPWIVRAVSRPGRWTGALAGAALLSALSWVFLMHWSFVVAGLLCYPFVAHGLGRPAQTKRVLSAVSLSFMAALPYVLFLVSNFHWGHGGAVAEKVWLQLGYEEGFYNVFAVGYEHGALFLLSLIGIAGMVKRRLGSDLVWLSLLAGCVLGWAGYLVLFAVDKIIEPDEFYFYSRFLLTLAAGSGAFFLWRKARESLALEGKASSRALCLGLVLLLPQTFPYWWNPLKMDRYYELALSPLPNQMVEMARWIRDETSPDAVFVAGGATSLWIASLSGRRVLTTANFRPTFDFEERVDLERRMIVGGEEAAFREAQTRFGVSHLAIDPAYLEALGADPVSVESMPWLRILYRRDGLRIFAIRVSGASQAPP
ncbi:MAG TPA: hypothetical protein VEK15_32105 [Vicinamibacteria bacterium]|nr:hypothetical protein [Vicinamibacteria bacterium]